jgi:hypothetical protein
LRLREAFAQVLPEIAYESQGVIASRAARRCYVDVAVANHMTPRRSQQRHVLPSAHCQVPVQGAACLSLSDRDVDPLWLSTLDDADEFREVSTRLIGINDVVAVRESEQVIGPRCENQLPEAGTSSSRGAIAIFESSS